MRRTIDELLQEVRDRAENYGAICGRKETAKDYVEGVYAKLYDDIPQQYDGSVAERDSWIKRQDEYIQAVERKENAFAEWKASEIFIKCLFAEVEVWRSREATARQQDKVHV